MLNSIVVIFTRWNTGGVMVFENTIKQILFFGMGGLTVVGLAGAGLGVIGPIVFFSTGFPNDLVRSIYGQVFIVTIVRELGPLLTGLIVISRSGTAIATEIGNMNANREFDALTSMGIDVVHYVITPRVVGMVISLVCLNIYFCFMSIIFSSFMFNLNNVSYNTFFNEVFNGLVFKNIYLSLIKSLGMGLIISSISSYEGYRKKVTFNDVPKILTRATGKCVVWSLSYYGIITVLSYV